MIVEMLRDVKVGAQIFPVGNVEVPDNLAAAFIYQGIARMVLPPGEVAALLPPAVKTKRRYVRKHIQHVN